jgi:glycosyltransferase involved in cell wall biosynthesis
MSDADRSGGRVHCPLLQELGPAPRDKSGWPWTEASPPLPDTMSNGSPWPKLSVVTPSYNQGSFIEETIRSVLLQGYPDLEYVTIDGGSTDNTMDIILKYAPWLSYWVSEPDRGQTDAINKGWRICRGHALTWLNSDDILMPGGLACAVEALFAGMGRDLVYGNVYHIDATSQRTGQRLGQPFVLNDVLESWHNVVPQPGFVMKRSVQEQTGELDADMRFSMDFDYWLRLALSGGRLVYVPTFLAAARLHSFAKTSQIQLVAAQEQIRICEKISSYADFGRFSAKRNMIRGAAYLSAAYWSYLAGDATETRTCARRALRYHAKGRRLALALWLASLAGDGGMVQMRKLWRAQRMYRPRQSMRGAVRDSEA